MGKGMGKNLSPRAGAICLFGAEEMLGRLRGVFQEIPGVLTLEDPENLHRMRVASRRIRSAFPLLENCVDPGEYTLWRKRTRVLTKALGKARDVDVQKIFLENLLKQQELCPGSALPGMRRLLLRLDQLRDELQHGVEEVVAREEREPVLHGMERRLRQLVVHLRLRGASQDDRALRERAREMLSLRLEEVLALGYVMESPDFLEGHHDLRIGVKRLRYTLELFRPLFSKEKGKEYIQQLKNLQTLLGDLHDLDVWGEMLPGHIEAERARTTVYYGHPKAFPQLEKGLRFLQEYVAESRRDLFEQTFTLWKSQEKEAFWESLYEEFEALLSGESGLSGEDGQE